MSFPYIKTLTINDCYAYKNLQVDAEPDGLAFKHIILTGKNGSGKSTILRSLNKNFGYLRIKGSQEKAIKNFQIWISDNPNSPNIPNWQSQLEMLSQVNPSFSTESNYFLENNPNYILHFFGSKRHVLEEKITTVTDNSEFEKALSGEKEIVLSTRLKQYLVNKKVAQAFDQIEQRPLDQNQNFFENFELILQTLFSDKTISLIFKRNKFDFSIKGKDGEISIEHLSDGFSSALSIFLDLMVRVDLIRQNIGDYTFEVPGIILIDEPENHLHLELQYAILPIITTFFPGIQIIAATHSPAVISSLPNAVVYDISTQKTISDWPLGCSFSELMLRHFGLENEYGPVADKIIDDVKAAVKNKDRDKLFSIFTENEKYLEGNTLKIEIENELIRMEAGKLVK